MSYASTNMNSAGLADDYVNPTVDVWLDELDKLHGRCQATWRESGRKYWAVPISRNVSAFEAVDFPDNATLDEVNSGEFTEFPVILSFPEESTWLLRCICQVHEVLARIPLERRHAAWHQQTSFSPDFFDIRRCARYIMGSTPLSTTEQERVSQSERGVPIAIHPEVIREAEEKSLTNDLDISVELARQSYPALSKIAVNLERDPEIQERRTIRFTLTVSGDPETILQNEGVFRQRLRSKIGDRARELITISYNWGK